MHTPQNENTKRWPALTVIPAKDLNRVDPDAECMHVCFVPLRDLVWQAQSNQKQTSPQTGEQLFAEPWGSSAALALGQQSRCLLIQYKLDKHREKAPILRHQSEKGDLVGSGAEIVPWNYKTFIDMSPCDSGMIEPCLDI